MNERTIWDEIILFTWTPHGPRGHYKVVFLRMTNVGLMSFTMPSRFGASSSLVMKSCHWAIMMSLSWMPLPRTLGTLHKWLKAWRRRGWTSSVCYHYLRNAQQAHSSANAMQHCHATSITHTCISALFEIIAYSHMGHTRTHARTYSQQCSRVRY